MAVIQSTFGSDIDAGYPGSEASGELSNIISRNLESATCGFGKALFAGAGDSGAVTVPSARLLGIAISNKGLPVTSARPADTFITGDTIAIKNRGAIRVAVSVAVADGDAVYVTPAGLFTNLTPGNTALAGWEFADTLGAAGIGRVVRR